MFEKGARVRLKTDHTDNGRVHIVSSEGTHIRISRPDSQLSRLLLAEDYEPVPRYAESKEDQEHRERGEHFEELQRRALTIFTDEQWYFVTHFHAGGKTGCANN